MISVCLATYNGEKYLYQQLDSILCQLNDNDEVIISDDGSMDSTVDIIKSFNDKRIRLFTGNSFSSPIRNFENALKKVQGDYVFLCDQDDVWLPNKVQTVISFLSKYDLVVSDCKVVDAELNTINDSFFYSLASRQGFWRNLRKNTYLGCCMAFKKEVLRYVLPFPNGIAMHDIWIGLSVELHGKSFFLDQPLMLYRRHGNNVSFGGGKSKYSICYRIQYRFHMLYCLLKRRYIK